VTSLFLIGGFGCSSEPAGEIDTGAGVVEDSGTERGPEDTGEDDVADGADRDGGVTDAQPEPADTESDGEDGGEADVDTGPDCTLDDDADGLTNCEEENLCTDPLEGDTDGDGLGDGEELQRQTDPCAADSDGDGAADLEEIEAGLDPNRVDTYGDGQRDGDRWILNACDNPSTEPVEFYESRVGNWTIALPPPFSNYTELTIVRSIAPQAAAVYDDTSNEVAGFLLSQRAGLNQSGPSDALRREVIGRLNKVGSVVQDSTGGSFDTHDGKHAAIGEYLLEVDQPTSTRRIRQELLFELASFPRQNTSGLPNSAGRPFTTFRVAVSVIFRKNASGADQSLISLAVAPGPRFDGSDQVQFRMDDLTNTTNISEQVDSHLVKCATFQAATRTPRAEFYWVLDQSGSMDDDNQKVADFASQFEAEVRNTSLDYRLGVTNMDLANQGKLRRPPAWHTDGNTFQKEVQDAVIDCSSSARWRCSGGSEYGLESAKVGIEHMTGQFANPPTPAEAVRSDAQIITIFMSDEEDNAIKAKQKTTQDYIQFFKGRTVAFAIVAGGSTAGCPQENGEAYKDVAVATGGKIASVCARDLTQTIRDIIYSASGYASNYELPQTPISSSLRVYLNGRWVPRSRDDGFEYFAEQNSIAFFGRFRPDTQGSADYVAVSYETFKDRCKQNTGGAFNCAGR
jgi:hypothetical protein